MKTSNISLALLFCSVFSVNAMAKTDDSIVPEPFRGFDASSKLTINYSDLDSLLDAAVLNTGPSDRKKASSSQAKTGTRMKVRVNRATVNEANRFYFEVFANSEKNQQTLRDIRSRLEKIPLLVPLERFSREEQLAYWINLYNITILDEIVRVYPEADLEKLLVGEESIQAKKILEVAGVPLSLDDIQFTILKQNYENSPLLVYGLYQGNIGGPNIRKNAYTGNYVYADLIDNAIEFINSNRGTYCTDDRVFRVSSLYARNKLFFNDFDPDLKEHLLIYLEGKERAELVAATTIKADINDWTVTDLFGSYREPAGSIANNNSAALLNARGGAQSSTRFANYKAVDTRYSPAVIKHLEEIKLKREGERTGSVTIEELGQVGHETEAIDKDDKDS